jgi:hypothetical protein
MPESVEMAVRLLGEDNLMRLEGGMMAAEEAKVQVDPHP